MKKIIYFIFLTSFSIYSQQSDSQSKSEITLDASIDINLINLDKIYDQQGLHYIGFGYYTAVAIASSKTRSTADASNMTQMSYCIAKEVRSSTRIFNQNGKDFYFTRVTWFRVSDYNHYPMMKKSEYIETLNKSKELLAFGLMEQSQYDKEFKNIKYNVKYYKFNSPYDKY
jgi:hypothetical protein